MRVQSASTVLPPGLKAASLLPLLATSAVAAEGGMPQLNPSSFIPQLVWLAITFIGLYLLMSKVLLPKIGGAIESRRNRVAADLDQAEALKAETERAVHAYEAALAEARGKAHAIAAETHDAMSAEAAGERERVDTEIAARVAEAERSIATAREQAMSEVERVAAEVAGDIVEKLTGGKAGEAEVAAALASVRSG